MQEQSKKTTTNLLIEAAKDLTSTLEDSKVTTTHKSKIDHLLKLIAINIQGQDIRIQELEAKNWKLQMANRDLKNEISSFHKKPVPTEREEELLNLINDSKKFFNRVRNQCFVAAYGENLDEWARRVAEVSSNYDMQIPPKSVRFKKVA